MLSIDSFLNTFSLSTIDKLKLLDEMQLAFKKEFNATKVLKSELDKHYRTLEKDISNFLNDISNQKLLPLNKIIEEKSRNIKPIVASIKQTWKSI